MGRRIFNTYGSSHGQVLIFLWATLAKSRARPSIIVCDIDDLIFTFFFQQVCTIVITTPLRYFQLNANIIHNLLMCYYFTAQSVLLVLPLCSQNMQTENRGQHTHQSRSSVTATLDDGNSIVGSCSAALTSCEISPDLLAAVDTVLVTGLQREHNSKNNIKFHYVIHLKYFQYSFWSNFHWPQICFKVKWNEQWKQLKN